MAPNAPLTDAPNSRSNQPAQAGNYGDRSTRPNRSDNYDGYYPDRPITPSLNTRDRGDVEENEGGEGEQEGGETQYGVQRGGPRVNRVNGKTYRNNGRRTSTTEKNDFQMRIDNSYFALLILVSLLFDAAAALVNLIPVAGGVIAAIVVTPLGGLTFYFMFARKNVSFRGSPTRAITLFLSPLLELIPVLNALPIWTAEVFILALSVRAEDEIKKHAELIQKLDKRFKIEERLSKLGKK